MKSKIYGLLLLCLICGAALVLVVPGPASNQTARTPKSNTSSPQVVATDGKLPLAFEVNSGQTDRRVKFLSRGSGYTLFLTGTEAVLALKKPSPLSNHPSALKLGIREPRLEKAVAQNSPFNLAPFAGFLIPTAAEFKTGSRLSGQTESLIPESRTPAVLRMKLVGADRNAKVIGVEELSGKSNYFLGSDPKKWRTNVRNYAKVQYKDVYPGVDLVYYGIQRQLEYDLMVAPGADPNQIKLSFAGADAMRVDAASGDLVLKVGDDEVRFHKPTVYQPAVGAVSARRRRSESAATAELDGTFVLARNNEVAFRVAGYDPKRALVIDPVLSYSTYLGGSGGDWGISIALDAAGSAYVTGHTTSSDFPTANPLQANCVNCLSYQAADAFVAKLNPTGSALAYSTYLGGSGDDTGDGIAVDSSGNAYITGVTSSTDFPTANPLQTNCDNCGSSNGDAFVAKLNASGSTLVYSTYLGGSNNDGGNGIAVDGAGNAYVAGVTSSTDFPTANPLQANCDNCGSSNGDAFVAKLNASGSALVYSTFLGGSDIYGGNGIAVDAAGNTYVTGSTSSTDFPTANPLQPSNHGGDDVFVAKLNPTGSALVYSTYLGGSNNDYGNGIAADTAGNAYVTGFTNSTDFPTANPLQGVCGGCSSFSDAFVAKLNPAGSALVYSTYLGGSGADYGYGIAADTAGNASLTGFTNSSDFPTANPLQANCAYCSVLYNSSGDAFVAKLSPAPAVSLSTNSLSFGTQNVSTASAEQSVTLTNTGDELLSITGITVSGDFAQTNTCGNSVNAGANCAINVTFTPMAAGTGSGMLTITDNASGSPQSVALSGTGQDFTLGASSGSSTSATVAPGQSTTYTLSVGGQGGMNQNVTFTCTGAPSEATCTVSPNPLTVGSSATNVTVTVTTTAASVSAPRSRLFPPFLPLSPVRGMLMLALVLAAMAWAIGRRNQPGVSRWHSTMVPLASALLLTLALAGCGGGGGGGGRTHNPGTPAGNYKLTVAGSTGSGSSALSHSVTLTLNVS